MKLRDRDAGPSDRRQRPRARQDRADAGRRPAHRRAGAQHRSRRRRARAARLWRAVARAAGRRLGPAAQQGDDRGQPAAAHALPLFLRHQPALQQAPARQRLRARSAASAASMPSSARAMPASRPIRATWRWRCARSTPRSRRCGRTARRARIPIAEFHRLPGDTPHIETDAGAGRTDHRGDAAEAGRRHAHLSQGARPRLLRLRAGLGRRDRAARRHRPRRARRRRAQAVARRGGRGRAAARRQGRRRAAARRRQADRTTTRSSCRWSSARSPRCWPKRRAEP